MEYLWVGACGLLLILGLVSIVMSRNIWRATQMIATVLVLISSLAFFYLAARTLRLHKNWQDEVNLYEKALTSVKKEIGKDEHSPADNLIVQRNDLRQQFNAALNLRGRVWSDGQKSKFNAQTGALTVLFENPPAGLDAIKRPVFVFQKDSEKSKNGHYLGEFVVSAAKDREISLTPVATLLQSELNNIDSARGDVVLYEVMPIDSHTLFATADPNDLKIWFPDPAVLANFKRDGKPATADDEKEHPESVQVRLKFLQAWAPKQTAAAPAVGKDAAAKDAVPPAEAPPATDDAGKPGPARGFAAGRSYYLPLEAAKELVDQKIAEYDTSEPEKSRIYVRPLWDYAQLFREAYRARTQLFAQKNEISAQADQLEGALTQVTEDLAATKIITDGLKSDLANFKAEAQILDQYAQTLGAKLDKTKAELSDTYRSNLKLAAALGDAQRQLSEKLRAAPPAQASASVDLRSGR